ncbi:MAG: divergent polysaccharide deacetylase family protein, partial [Desulfobacterales bacterium]|nr:divergent polysaccharide deacetylase family protein [Desulfobacterales bacterium]
RNLSALGRDIVVRDERLPDGRICCHVFVGDFYTHKISLQFDRPKPSSKDARPRIAIIIDDLGYDRNIAFSFIHMDLGLSFSILPSAPFTELIVREVNRQRSEVILHLPMETKDYPSVDPGPGALLLSMDENKIKSVLDRNLRWIRGAKGVNNHMGSAFTENREKMLVLLRELKKRGLFFIDSRTSSDTVGLELARKIGLPAAERRIFIDNNLAYKAMKIQMDRLLSAARHSGAAIAIGHPHKETLRILEEYRSKIMTEFQVVPVSDLVS